MSTIPAADLTKLRYNDYKTELFCTIASYPILWQGRVNGSFSRGARTINVDGGSGSVSFINKYMEVEVGTSLDDWDVGRARILSYAGTAASGTFTLDQNGLVWQDNLYIRVLLYMPTIAIHSRITPQEVWTVGMDTYSDQNTKPPPVCIAGTHQVKYVDSYTYDFPFDLSDSYPIANGASITSYGLSVYPTTGASATINAAGVGYIRVTQAGEWWAIASCTDSNGKTQYRYVYLAAFDDNNKPYTDFSFGKFNITPQSGGKANLTLTGDVSFDDIKNDALCILWFRSYFNDAESYPNALPYGDNILIAGYIKKERLGQNFESGDYELGINISTINETLTKTALRGIPLEMKATPTAWWHYGTDLTTGKAIHHLLKWHSTVLENHDVLGLMDNTQIRKGATFNDGTILSMVDDMGYNKGILSKMICDKTGRFWFHRDSQLLDTAHRSALDTIFTIVEDDCSSEITINRNVDQPNYTLLFGGVRVENISTGTPFRSLLPGYREDNFSYGLPDRRGSGSQNINNQLIIDQNDCNVKCGRIYARDNLDYESISIDFPGAYQSVLTIISQVGFYKFGIGAANLERYQELIDANLICRNISVSFKDGAFGVTGVFEPEAFGPNGIQSNYPDSMPNPTPPGEPLWDIDPIGYVPALLRFGSQNYREDTDLDWTDNSDNAGGPSFYTGFYDPFWKIVTGTNNPKAVIPYGGGYGFIAKKNGINNSDWIYITPYTDPPNTWADVVTPTHDIVTYNRIWMDYWLQGVLFATCYIDQGGLYDSLYRGWLLYSGNYGSTWNYVNLFVGDDLLYSTPYELYPLGIANNGTYVYVSLWMDDYESTKLWLLKLNKFTMTIIETYDFGDCTKDELESGVKFLYPVCVIDDDNLVFACGRFESQLTSLYGEIHQVDYSDDACTTWFTLENGWDVDLCGDFWASELKVVGGTNRNLYSIRHVPPIYYGD